jgi:hypothetical protein
MQAGVMGALIGQEQQRPQRCRGLSHVMEGVIGQDLSTSLLASSWVLFPLNLTSLV